MKLHEITAFNDQLAAEHDAAEHDAHEAPGLVHEAATAEASS